MYYGHMSKAEIMQSSFPFLKEIYLKYGKRACENLGVSSDKNEEEEETGTVSDYPVKFKKLSARERKEADEEFKSKEEFLALFN